MEVFLNPVVDDATAEFLDIVISRLEFYDTGLNAKSSPFQDITI